METNSKLLDSTLVVKYKTGVDAKGKDIVKTQRANDLNLSASDEVLMNLADVVESFIEHPVTEVVKSTDHLLTRV